MSLDGRFTPYQLATLTSLVLSSGNGFRINAATQAYQGTWTPSSYTQGSLTGNSVLYNLTRAIPLAYQLNLSSAISNNTYRNLIGIGSATIPALGNSRPASFVPRYTGTTWVTAWPNGSNGYDSVAQNSVGSDSYLSNGFLATVARQAYYEFYTGSSSQYNKFVKSILQNYGWKQQQNMIIGSYVNVQSQFNSSYSTASDLTSASISNISSDYENFGTDLVNLGFALTLSNIDTFGLPSNLLRILALRGAITNIVAQQLLLNDVGTSTTISNIAGGLVVPTVQQENKIYQAFTTIIGTDLDQIKVSLNIATQGLTSLADLLDPIKMFPTSYSSLVNPVYVLPQMNAGSNKNFVNIYNGSAVNANLPVQWSGYLDGILPADIAKAASALSFGLSQVSGVKNTTPGQLGQVIRQMRSVATTNPIQLARANSQAALAMYGQGSGSNGSYTMCDFLGAMSGVSYQSSYAVLSTLFQQNTFSTLASIYADIYTLVSGAGPYTNLQTLIDAANAEIAVIATNTGLRDQLNTLWSNIGNYLSREQLAITASAPSQAVIVDSISVNDFESFVRNIETYSMGTAPNEIEPVLRAIADPATTGGVSLVGALSEAQNAHLLSLVSIQLDNSIDTEIDAAAASATATVTGGVITAVTVTNGGAGYTEASCTCCAPSIFISDPTGMGFEGRVVVDMNTGMVTGIDVINGGTGYSDPALVISGPVVPTSDVGGPVVPGSFAYESPIVPESLMTV